MSWVNDLASVLGIPKGAATLAVAMYAACFAAEKAARPDALRFFTQVLTAPAREDSAPFFKRIFDLTFGERHLSWKCARRSYAATIIMIGIFEWSLGVIPGLFSALSRIQNPLLSSSYARIVLLTGALVVLITFMGAIPDYIALYKTRILLTILNKSLHWKSSCTIIGFDILASVSISVCMIILVNSVFVGISWASVLGLFREGVNVHSTALDAYPMSTLVTSIWTTLIVVSTGVIRSIVPLQRFTAWFFDVERRPLQAIGIVSGALIMTGSLVWTVLIHLL